MKQILDQHMSQIATTLVAVILVLVPFHAFLTVTGSSLVGHYTLLRLWEEVLLVPLLAAATYLIIRRPDLRRLVATSWLWRLVGAYLVVSILWAAVALWQNEVSLKAAAYGVLVNSRFLLFLLAAWTAGACGQWLRNNWQRIVLIPAAVVAGFGLLQRFVLPYDFLKHFGYGDQTIPAYATIDHKVQYLRIQSTLRGANFLGAYTIIVLSIVATVFHRWRLVAGLAVGLVVLFISGSRGAWVGAAVALAILLWLSLSTRKAKQIAAFAAVFVVLMGAGGVFALRDHDFVQNTVFHTDENSSSSESSNEAHFSATSHAFKQVVREPLGHGPGTAGPASLYNTEQPARIAENYFLQIGQETGWLGLGLFLAIYGLVAKQLWTIRHDMLARSLFAAMIGLTCMALLMHVWIDETIAFLFWGLTGIALAPLRRVKS